MLRGRNSISDIEELQMYVSRDHDVLFQGETFMSIPSVLHVSRYCVKRVTGLRHPDVWLVTVE